MNKTKSNKQKLFWINPLAHHVYDWWLRFFNKYFHLNVYDCNLNVKYPFVEQKNLKHLMSLKVWKGNFFNLYQNNFWIKKDDIVVVWDIFTNSLCLTIRKKNTVYYTEYFFRDRESWKKKTLFTLLSIFWKKKKILVPTLKAKKTWKRVSKKIFYLPQLFFWDIKDNKTLNDNKLKILFVGHLDDWKKNVKFMLDSLIEMKDENIEIWLCWSNDEYSKSNPSVKIDIKKYQNIFWNKFKYYGKVNHNLLDEIYGKHNLFVLPSLADPIWAVIMEAMAHSLPIVVSDNVWANDYIEQWTNGFTFQSNNKQDLINKITFFLDKKNRMSFGKESAKIVKNRYWYKNRKLLDKLYAEFVNFIKN